MQKIHVLHESIPESPDVSMHPQPFADALHAAEQRARSSSFDEASAGVAELGRLYHANSYLDEARRCWNGLQSSDSSNPLWPYYKADLLRLAGDESNMAPLIEESLRWAPEYAPGWLKLGNLHFARGNLDAAVGSYQQRLQLLPDDPYAEVALARIEMLQGSREQALERLIRLTRSGPTLPTAHNLLARLLREQGDTEGADEHQWLGTAAGRFREAPDPWIDGLSQWCYDIEHLLMLGSIDYQTNHGDLGKSLFERALQLDPKHPEPYEALGRIYLDAGEHEAARDMLEQGLPLPRAPASLFFRLSEAYRQLDRAQKALEVAEAGLSREPGDPDLLKSVGSSLDALGRHDEAIEAFEAAMQDGTHAAEANLNIGLVLIHADRKDEAGAYLERALQLRPKYPQALAELGVLALDDWDLDRAERHIREFYDNYPGSLRALELMAQLSVRQSMQAARSGDLVSAEKACLEGLELHPKSPDLNSVLGLLYAQQQRFPEAIVLLETARQSRPADPRIVVNLAQIHAQLGHFDQARWVLTEGERRLLEEGKHAEARQVKRLRDQLPAAGSRR